MKKDWKIYYEDGSTFDNTQGLPEDAPSFGVLCVVFPDEEVGRMVMHGWDWFYYHKEDQNWWGADIHGLLDCLLHNKPMKAVKQGRNTNADNYKKILNFAIDDPDFSVKSGEVKRERPRTYIK